MIHHTLCECEMAGGIVEFEGVPDDYWICMVVLLG